MPHIKMPYTYCRECKRKTTSCRHRIAHAHDLAPCDCPPTSTKTVDWLMVYRLTSPDRSLVIYECTQCEEIWILENNRITHEKPDPLLVEELILGTFPDGKERRMLHLLEAYERLHQQSRTDPAVSAP